MTVIKNACVEAFENPPAQGQIYGELSKRIRAAIDKELGGRGWNVIVGRSFGAHVTHKVRCFVYLSAFPGVNVLCWRS